VTLNIKNNPVQRRRLRNSSKHIIIQSHEKTVVCHGLGSLHLSNTFELIYKPKFTIVANRSTKRIQVEADHHHAEMTMVRNLTISQSRSACKTASTNWNETHAPEMNSLIHSDFASGQCVPLCINCTMPVFLYVEIGLLWLYHGTQQRLFEIREYKNCSYSYRIIRINRGKGLRWP